MHPLGSIGSDQSYIRPALEGPTLSLTRKIDTDILVLHIGSLWEAAMVISQANMDWRLTTLLKYAASLPDVSLHLIDCKFLGNSDLSLWHRPHSIRNRQPRPLLRHPWRRVQLWSRHRVRVPTTPAEPYALFRDTLLSENSAGSSRRCIKKVVRRGRRERSGHTSVDYRTRRDCRFKIPPQSILF